MGLGGRLGNCQNSAVKETHIQVSDRSCDIMKLTAIRHFGIHWKSMNQILSLVLGEMVTHHDRTVAPPHVPCG